MANDTLAINRWKADKARFAFPMTTSLYFPSSPYPKALGINFLFASFRSDENVRLLDDVAKAIKWRPMSKRVFSSDTH